MVTGVFIGDLSGWHDQLCVYATLLDRALAFTSIVGYGWVARQNTALME